MMISCILDFLTKLYNCKIILQFFNKVAVLAQLGERQTEEFENFGQLKLSGGPVFDPQKSHFYFWLFYIEYFSSTSINVILLLDYYYCFIWPIYEN